MPGYDSSPVPSLHFNCTGKLTILPEIPHSGAPNNTTPSPVNHFSLQNRHPRGQHLDRISHKYA